MIRDRYWGQENPRWMVKLKTTSRDHVMVWAGIIDTRLIGPYFFDDTVNSDTYLEMLENFAIPELRRHGFEPREICFAHDGAPAHGTRQVRDFLTQNFHSFIGRGDGALIQWAARSPDFNPCDIFLWAYTKHLCYQTRAQNIEELKAKVDESFDNVTVEMLNNVHENLLKRLTTCIRENGDIYEHILNG